MCGMTFELHTAIFYNCILARSILPPTQFGHLPSCILATPDWPMLSTQPVPFILEPHHCYHKNPHHLHNHQPCIPVTGCPAHTHSLGKQDNFPPWNTLGNSHKYIKYL